jgi:hypothetical protein
MMRKDDAPAHDALCRKGEGKVNSKVANIVLVGCATAGIWFGVTPRAAATIIALPDAVWSGSANTGVVGPPGNSCCIGIQHPVTGPGTTTTAQTSFYGENAFSQVQAVGLPFPAITASATVGPASSAISAGALAQLIYDVEIIGPAGFVPLDITSHSSLSSTAGVGEASTNAQLAVGGNLLLNAASISGGGALGFSTENNTLLEYAGQPIQIIMFVEASAEGPSAANSATAFLDPYFFVDPNFPNVGLYSVITSPGIGNSPDSAIPEPPSLLVIFAGLASLGLLYGRSRLHSSVR